MVDQPLSKALPQGKRAFTAVAREKSGLGNEAGVSETRSFEVNTEAPDVTLAQPPTPSNDTTPSFSGTASEDTEVKVTVKLGAETVGTVSTMANAGKWSATLSTALAKGKHSFTAQAAEKSELGNAEGVSETRSFEVNTEPPVVTLKAPPSPSNDMTPAFSGTASEATEVEVQVFEGSELLATGTTVASGGSWTIGTLSKSLPSGRHSFIAQAFERSGLGNADGHTAPAGFEVNTNSPEVTLNQPKSPSSNTNPTFSGSASENTEVVVHVMSGAEQVATATAVAKAGTWTSGALSKALAGGKHAFTAFATEKSGLGNPEGTSETRSFEVNTEAPVVTLNQPLSPSNDTNPSFSGTASEDTQVVIRVFEGSTEVATATTTASGGKWSTSGLSKLLPSGKHVFAAQAFEKSGLGNEEGKSETRSFEVSTEAPKVSLTAPASPSNNVVPQICGTTSEEGEVRVAITLAAETVSSGSTIAQGGSWCVTLGKALPSGKHVFTAQAFEASGLGNEEGKSVTVSFEVNTEPPVVTINPPPARSKDTSPTFSGTASEDTEVTVLVKLGAETVATATTTASGGKWSTGSLSKALASGKHTFTVQALEKSGLGNSEGTSSSPSFEVNTEPPVVTVNQLALSNDTTPTFSGAATEETEVAVTVKLGAEVVGTVSTTASGGKWTATLGKALAAGKHTFTAQAVEKSGLGNPSGTSSSMSFDVNTEPPTVTLNQPTSPSNNTTPKFAGAASENTEVVVHVMLGSEEVATAVAQASGGSWTSGSLSNALPTGKHTFTAFAKEKSALGNEEGKSAAVSFDVNTEPPVVTLNAIKTPSKVVSPTFGGSASENSEIVVTVKLGAETVATGSTTALVGSWSATLSEALPAGKHTFTATAKEKSLLGNSEGASAPITFEVNTEPPTVTVEPPPPVSNIQTPNFSGTASETDPVSVLLYAGAKAEGKPFKELTAEVKEHHWTSAHVAQLPSNKYTVVASEKSALGNPTGASTPITFEINTNAPTVTVTQPKSPSNILKPSFSGTVSGTFSELKPVTLYIYEGATAEGPIVRQMEAPIVKGSWSSSALGEALPAGKHTYTAQATTPSSIAGNPTGVSAPVTFIVNTEAPVVKLEAPVSPSNHTKPTFKGTASEAEPVTIAVYAGPAASGVPIGTVTAKVTGETWESGAFPKTLEDGQYTAVATQQSAIGNGDGSSKPVSFVINTKSPVVTLNPLPTPSPNKDPSFSGSASETGPVTVYVYKASTKGEPEGAAIEKIEAEGDGGQWASGRLEEPLPEWRTYVAVAVQESPLGNPKGESKPVVFTAEQIAPTVESEPVGEVGRTTAALYANVNPHGGPVKECFFEYGATTAYGTRVDCGFVAELAAFPPAATGAVAVFARIYALHPITTYHVRVVAEGEGGTGRGADVAFTTLEALSFPNPPETAAVDAQIRHRRRGSVLRPAPDTDWPPGEDRGHPQAGRLQAARQVARGGHRHDPMVLPSARRQADQEQQGAAGARRLGQGDLQGKRDGCHDDPPHGPRPQAPGTRALAAADRGVRLHAGGRKDRQDAGGLRAATLRARPRVRAPAAV